MIGKSFEYLLRIFLNIRYKHKLNKHLIKTIEGAEID